MLVEDDEVDSVQDFVLKEIFDQWDADRNGHIDKKEFRGFVSSFNEGMEQQQF